MILPVDNEYRLGPILSKAVPALDAIFGGSEQKKDDGRSIEKALIPSLTEIKAMLGDTLNAINNTREELDKRLTNIEQKAEHDKRLEKYDAFKEKVIPAM
jgi:hypothetical protein